MPRKRMDPLLSAVIARLPAPAADKPFGAPEREAFVTMLRNAFDVVYGPIGIVPPSLEVTFTRPPAPAVTSGPKLYVIKEDGHAFCDGQPMALKDLPANVTFTDKRGAIADAQFAWESILWSDVGAVAPGTAMPPGLTLVPKAGGVKLRSVSGGEDDAEIMT